VVLEVAEGEAAAQAAYERLNWEQVGSVAALEQALKEHRWSAVRIGGIADARVERELQAQRLIETGADRAEAAGLRRQLNERSGQGVDPEALWALAEKYGYEIEVSWESAEKPGYLQVQLRNPSQAVPRVSGTVASAGDPAKPWSAYANDPLENSFRQQLIPQLREYLKERVPEYMVPQAWMVLKQLPLTPNGKLDRRALPAPQSRPEEMGEYVAPRTDLQRTLAQIWAQILRVDQVGIQDNFFELGGHSLLATRVITQIGQVLDMELPLRTLFTHPTIETLSGAIAEEITAAVAMEEQ
jgi:hypothetical protein